MSVVERVAADLEALDAAERGQAGLGLDRGGEVAHRAADPDDLAAGARQPAGFVFQRLVHVRAQRLARLLRRRVVIGEEVLGHPHGAERPGAEVAGMAAEHLDELQRAAAEVEHGAVGERRRVDRREVAVVGLLLAAEDPDLEAGLVADAIEEGLLVGRVADRARRDGLDLVRGDAGRLAEVGEHVGGLERALHRRLAELAGRVEPLADAHRQVDLVGALPPAVGGREDDEPKRVRAHVDDRRALLWHGVARSARGRGGHGGVELRDGVGGGRAGRRVELFMWCVDKSARRPGECCGGGELRAAESPCSCGA